MVSQSQSILDRTKTKLNALRWWLEIDTESKWEVYSSSKFATELQWSFARFNLSGQAITEVWVELNAANAASNQ